jgi:Glycosyl transferases group 1
MATERSSTAPLRIAYVSFDARMNFLRDALRRRGGDVTHIDGDDIDRITRVAGAAASIAVPRMEWWIRYQMSSPVRRRRASVATGRLAEGDPPDAIVFAGSWFTIDMQRPDGRRVPTFHYIDQSMSRAPLPGEQRGWGPFGRPGIEAQGVMYRKAGGVFTMSEWARDQTIVEHPQLPPGRVEAVGWGPCAVDLSAANAGFHDRERQVLLVAMDFYRKGARAVRQKSPETRFILIGEDQSRSRMNLGDDIEYWGVVRDRSRLEDAFLRSRLFLMPHRYDRSPHVLAEAASAGTPIVTGVQGGPPEVPRRDGGGAVHHPEDHAAIAETVLRLIGDEGVWSKASEAIRSTQQTYYAWDAIAAKLMARIALGAHG